VDIKIGIEDADRKEIADGLARLLADSYSLYLKSHNYHWNVTGPMFRSLHLMFEEHYIELADAVDVVAERIRALGFPAPATFSEYRSLSAIEAKEGVPEAMEMVRDLVVGHETVARTAREVVAIAENGGDVATADLATARVEVHDKTAWMLRATAE
jgi:starvation-inducible DNA-binding protein